MGNVARGYRSDRQLRRGGIYVHSGSIAKPWPWYQIKVDSETQEDVVYYVSFDGSTGKVERCTCPAFGLYPERICKHMQAVIDQRLIQG
jgi:uncharacterized Zn finger protein